MYVLFFILKQKKSRFLNLNLCNYRHFLYYLIESDIKLVDFDKFVSKEAWDLCKHIDNYTKENNAENIYLFLVLLIFHTIFFVLPS